MVVLPAGERAEEFARLSVAGFDVRVPSLYDPEDAAAGAIEVDGPAGGRRRVPLVSLSVGVASSGRRRFDSPADMLAAAAEQRALAKRAPGSGWASDAPPSGG